jgi:hypothetical protein
MCAVSRTVCRSSVAGTPVDSAKSYAAHVACGLACHVATQFSARAGTAMNAASAAAAIQIFMMTSLVEHPR